MPRFWKYVQKLPGGGCWLWQSHLQNGYGMFWHAGRAVLAHRFAYTQLVGPIPAGFCVCHRCDTPACVRPEHFFIGTSKDNVHDAVNKGRHKTVPMSPGEANVNHKLTAVQVARIRARYATEKITQKALGACYGVSEFAVHCIVHGRTWRSA